MFFSHFFIIISYIFTEFFIKILSEDITFYFFDFKCFCQFLGFFLPLLAPEKANNVSIYKISAVIRVGSNLKRLFKNCIELY